MKELPGDVRFIERDWLSANMIVIGDTIIDTGYFTHQAMTLQLVAHAYGKNAPRQVINTHLHSDHCGGNAALQRLYPGLRTLIPHKTASAVADWDDDALSYRSTGQDCERFGFTDILSAGDELELGKHRFRALPTGGHDETMLCLYCEKEGLLISADALWENGFGILFSTFAGGAGIDEQQQTLNQLAPLDVRIVMPGHGRLFRDFKTAITQAQNRLDYFAQEPERVWRNGIRVLLKFQLLAHQSMTEQSILQLFEQSALPKLMAQQLSAGTLPVIDTIMGAADDLVKAGVARWEAAELGRRLVNETRMA